MKVKAINTQVYRIPTATPEADGTIYWNATTMVLVRAAAENGQEGIGYSYASPAADRVITEMLAPLVIGKQTDYVREAWKDMVRAVRNIGLPGIAATAISAVDIALWDLKAHLANQPLFQLLGPRRNGVPIYGSGGFTTYTFEQLAEQLGGWVQQGIPRVKMKIGTDWGTKPEEDVARVKVARQAISPQAELFVDANGAYTPKQAISQARRFAEYGVTYFEEPVSSDHHDQLALIRQAIDMDVAAGEYGYSPWYFANMLKAEAVDILQADVTRCLGVTGWLEAADLAHTYGTPFSAHTSPSIHAQVGCAAQRIEHVEYFYDHVRIENMFFEGVPQPREGCLYPDPNRPGLGLELKQAEADKFRINA